MNPEAPVRAPGLQPAPEHPGALAHADQPVAPLRASASRAVGRVRDGQIERGVPEGDLDLGATTAVARSIGERLLEDPVRRLVEWRSERAGGAGANGDHVDRMTGGVVQVPRDPGALLRGGKAPERRAPGEQHAEPVELARRSARAADAVEQQRQRGRKCGEGQRRVDDQVPPAVGYPSHPLSGKDPRRNSRC
jgi:hypothetical protein